MINFTAQNSFTLLCNILNFELLTTASILNKLFSRFPFLFIQYQYSPNPPYYKGSL